VEIYGIMDIVEVINDLPYVGLVLSDPSGNYYLHFRKHNIDVPQNVYIIPYPHDFMQVISSCDAVVRATSTDGDSISVREGLFLGKAVLTSDCVSRPNGCRCYKTGDIVDLRRALLDLLVGHKAECLPENVSAYTQLRNYYIELLDMV
jgi:hypothetical protein